LRWCLSKIRRLLDDREHRRLIASGDAVALDLNDCLVDVIEIADAIEQGISTLTTDRLQALAALFAGDFMAGVEVERSAQFNSWLLAQRRRLRAMHASILEHLVASIPVDAAIFPHLEKWLELFPFDIRPHEILLGALARHARIVEGEEHVAATVRLFEAEGLDWRRIREAWHEARARARSDTVFVAAGRSGPVAHRAGKCGESEPEFRARTLHARVRP
jgi:DNA-binding SARP family transcriptional activator